MFTKKKKISRKEIKQDQLVTFYYKVVAFYEQFKKNIFIVAGSLAIVIVAFILFRNAKKTSNEAASYELSQIIKVYEAGAYQDAIEGRPGSKIKGLKKIVEDHGSTEVGEASKIFLANSYYALKKYDDALKQYEDFGGSNNYLKAAAYAGEAACQEAKGSLEKAADLYLKASKVSSSNVLNPQYLINAGINYLSAGKTDDAKDAFLKVKRDYAKSAYSRDVERYLTQVE